MALLGQRPPVFRREPRPGDDPAARERARKRIETKRHFHVELVVAGVAVVLLVLTWATTEYHNAGGWPAGGFSQSSGVHDVWHGWTVYPLVGIALVLGGRAWFVYGNRRRRRAGSSGSSNASGADADGIHLSGPEPINRARDARGVARLFQRSPPAGGWIGAGPGGYVEIGGG